MGRTFTVVACVSLVGALAVSAADVPVAAKKLIVVDKSALIGKAKIVYVAKDPAITKGAGTDVAMIDVVFDLAYAGVGSVAGAFVVPPGGSNGTDGWKANKASVAKYVNKTAPGGPTGVKVAVVKPGKLLKVVGKSTGDTPIDVVGAGPPPSGVETVYTVTNGGETSRHCSAFPTCVHKAIAGGTGAKLVCKNGMPAACPAGATTTTLVTSTTTSSSTSVPTTSSSTSSSSSSSSSSTTSTSTSTAPSCSDFLQNGDETDVDCGGSICGPCDPGQNCLANSDCTSSVCSAFVCLAATCSDGVQNGGETDVDCGGPCGDCPLGDGCSVNGDCVSGNCVASTCRCPATNHSFSVTSSTGGLITGAEWPGGTQVFNATSECNVTIQNPDARVDLVCTLADPFAVVGFTGFSSCVGTGGEDGDGCQPGSCPLLGIGSCCATRPSCSTALNGSATAQYHVQCTP